MPPGGITLAKTVGGDASPRNWQAPRRRTLSRGRGGCYRRGRCVDRGGGGHHAAPLAGIGRWIGKRARRWPQSQSRAAPARLAGRLPCRTFKQASGEAVTWEMRVENRFDPGYQTWKFWIPTASLKKRASIQRFTRLIWHNLKLPHAASDGHAGDYVRWCLPIGTTVDACVPLSPISSAYRTSPPILSDSKALFRTLLRWK